MSDRGAAADVDAPGLAARRLALDVLIPVAERGQPLDETFDRTVKQYEADAHAPPLAPRDRAFARALVSETLRRRGRIDAVLGGYLETPLPDKAVAARCILRLGAAQMLFLDTPPHAATHAMTALTSQRRDAQGFTRLVNAVLRRVSREGADALAGLTPADDWPAWLTDAWAGAYGEADAAALAQACGAQAPLDLTVRDPATADPWAERLNGERLGAATVRVASGGDVVALPGFEDGAWWVQDAAAALPAQIVLAMLGDADGARVLDLCAAPGGKTLQLAAAGADVTAVDRSAPRLKRLRQNLKRTGLTARIDTLDGRDAPALAAREGLFDAVLVDAPCTATGTLRRRPDVAWSKAPQDAETLSTVQTDLLVAAAAAAKPGAPIVYCTCSLQPEEGAPVIAAAQERAAAAGAPLVMAPGVSETLLAPMGFAAPQPGGAWRTFPHQGAGADGFFIAALHRL